MEAHGPAGGSGPGRADRDRHRFRHPARRLERASRYRGKDGKAAGHLEPARGRTDIPDRETGTVVAGWGGPDAGAPADTEGAVREVKRESRARMVPAQPASGSMWAGAGARSKAAVPRGAGITAGWLLHGRRRGNPGGRACRPARLPARGRRPRSHQVDGGCVCWRAGPVVGSTRGNPASCRRTVGSDRGIGQLLGRFLGRAVRAAGISEEMMRSSKSALPVGLGGRVGWCRPVANGRPASPSRVTELCPRTAFVPFAEAGASQAGRLLINPMLDWLEE